MLAIIGAVLFCVMMIFTLLVICGLPLGEFTMGGQYKILPVKFRIISILFIIIQLFAIFIILQSGGYFSLWFSGIVTKGICLFFAAYLTINTFMNLFSKSKKEKYLMTPLSLLSAICFWVTWFKYDI